MADLTGWRGRPTDPPRFVVLYRDLQGVGYQGTPDTAEGTYQDCRRLRAQGMEPWVVEVDQLGQPLPRPPAVWPWWLS